MMKLLQQLKAFKPHQDIILLVLTLCLLLAFATEPTQDTFIYHCYAKAFFQGGSSLTHGTEHWCQEFRPTITSAPFQTLPSEYPILSLVIFSFPLLLPFLSYDLAFMALISVVIIRLFFFIRSARSTNASVLFLVFVILTASTIGSRYDLIPAALVLLSIVAAEKKKLTTAYVYLALATLLKLYPLLLLLPLFLYEQTLVKRGSPAWKRFLRVGLYGVSLLASLLLAYNISPHNVVGFIQYLFNRPVQIESIPATFLWLASLIHHISFCITYQYGSLAFQETISATCKTAAPSLLFTSTTIVSTVLFLIGYVLALFYQYKNKFSLLQTVIALLLLLLCTSKVLSPQYVIWLIPLILWNKKQIPSWLLLWLGILFLTAAIHPWLYYLLQHSIDTPLHKITDHIFFAVVGVRNLLLVASAYYWFTTGRAPK